MGIDGIENLTVGEFVEQIRNIDRDDYHVVIVGRTGEHVGSGIYLVGPGSRRDAIHTGEKAYRREFKAASNIALLSKIGFTGKIIDCEAFIERLENMMKEHFGKTGETEFTQALEG